MRLAQRLEKQQQQPSGTAAVPPAAAAEGPELWHDFRHRAALAVRQTRIAPEGLTLEELMRQILVEPSGADDPRTRGKRRAHFCAPCPQGPPHPCTYILHPSTQQHYVPGNVAVPASRPAPGSCLLVGAARANAGLCEREPWRLVSVCSPDPLGTGPCRLTLCFEADELAQHLARHGAPRPLLDGDDGSTAPPGTVPNPAWHDAGLDPGVRALLRPALDAATVQALHWQLRLRDERRATQHALLTAQDRPILTRLVLPALVQALQVVPGAGLLGRVWRGLGEGRIKSLLRIPANALVFVLEHPCPRASARCSAPRGGAWMYDDGCWPAVWLSMIALMITKAVRMYVCLLTFGVDRAQWDHLMHELRRAVDPRGRFPLLDVTLRLLWPLIECVHGAMTMSPGAVLACLGKVVAGIVETLGLPLAAALAWKYWGDIITNTMQLTLKFGKPLFGGMRWVLGMAVTGPVAAPLTAAGTVLASAMYLLREDPDTRAKILRAAAADINAPLREEMGALFAVSDRLVAAALFLNVTRYMYLDRVLSLLQPSSSDAASSSSGGGRWWWAAVHRALRTLAATVRVASGGRLTLRDALAAAADLPTLRDELSILWGFLEVVPGLLRCATQAVLRLVRPFVPASLVGPGRWLLADDTATVGQACCTHDLHALILEVFRQRDALVGEWERPTTLLGRTRRLVAPAINPVAAAAHGAWRSVGDGLRGAVSYMVGLGHPSSRGRRRGWGKQRRKWMPWDRSLMTRVVVRDPNGLRRARRGQPPLPRCTFVWNARAKRLYGLQGAGMGVLAEDVVRWQPAAVRRDRRTGHCPEEGGGAQTEPNTK